MPPYFTIRKLLSVIVGLIITFLVIIPPLELSINFTNSPIRFVWTFLFCGVLSFYFIFSKANIFLKVLVPYLFLNTFLSSIPHFSMAAFIYAIAGAYFYLLCLEIRDWKIVLRFLLSILMLESLLAALRILNRETLLNFGKSITDCWGSVGNGMQFKALIIILVAFTIQGLSLSRKYIIGLSVGLALICGIYFFSNTKIVSNFMYARGPVWYQTIEAAGEHPVVGYGLGTFKVVFPALSEGWFTAEGRWENTHNDFLQVLFETGLVGFIVLLAYVIYLLIQCTGVVRIGILMIVFSMCFYFPMRQDSTCPLLIMFLSFCDYKIRGKIL